MICFICFSCKVASFGKLLGLSLNDNQYNEDKGVLNIYCRNNYSFFISVVSILILIILLFHPYSFCNRVAILAFHKALACVPRDPLVVATFSLAVHNGGDMLEAVNISRRINSEHNQNYSEILEPRMWDEDKGLINEVLDLASSVITALESMTDEYFVSQKMAQYPQAPMSNLVSSCS